MHRGRRGRDTASEAQFGKRIDAIERRRNEARPAGSMPGPAPIPAGLVLSIMHPAFEALFTGLEAPQGGPRAFYVTTFAERDGKKHILTFALEATASAPIPDAADTRSPADGDGDLS